LGTPLSSPWLRAGLVALAATLATAGVAEAQQAVPQSAKSAGDAKIRAVQEKRAASDVAGADSSLLSASTRALVDPGHQHGGTGGHLPPVSRNVELVSKLSPTSQFGDIVPEQIADLAVHDDFAYLNSWNEPTCTRGGIYVVDIKNPRKPKEAGFIPALPGSYHGEGAHVIDAKTKYFKGHLLAVNNEYCAAAERGGGFDLYDVTNPKRPEILVQGFGDFGPEGSLVGAETAANSSHSVFLWPDGKKLYAVSVDNEELHDVDIFDVTDPRNPQPVAEHDLVELFPQIVDNSALGNLIFHHDMVVKEIGGHQVMSSSYWDAGYVLLNVDDPANPVYIGDSSFDGADPLTGLTPPEGNAHQSEFSTDNRFLLAADEDFNPYRAGTFSITTGPNAGEFPSAEVGGGASAATLPDQTLNGPVVYGGYGCDASAPIPPRASTLPATLPEGQEAIVVLQRGPAFDPDEDYDGDGDIANDSDDACFPGDKAANASEAGYDAVLLINRHQASGNQADDSPSCGSGGYPPGLEMVTLCTTHEAGHLMFGDEPSFAIPADDDVELVPLGTVGEMVEGQSVFDGWGYAHLYRAQAGKLQEIDAYAIPESLDPAFASGFGDLSIHEFAVDQQSSRLAYSSYYAGGARVFSYGSNGLSEVGAFIDEGGNNFWGVEDMDIRGKGHHGGRRYFALSDRDYGLYILRYTG
jgi:hypothetical protein